MPRNARLTRAGERSYAPALESERSRARALYRFLYRYNHHRHHTTIEGSPASRVINLAGHHTYCVTPVSPYRGFSGLGEGGESVDRLLTGPGPYLVGFTLERAAVDTGVGRAGPAKEDRAHWLLVLGLGAGYAGE